MIAQYDLNQWKELARILESDSFMAPTSRSQVGVIIRDLIQEVEAMRDVLGINTRLVSSESNEIGELSDKEIEIIDKLNKVVMLINDIGQDGVVKSGVIYNWCSDEISTIVNTLRDETYGRIVREAIEYRWIKRVMGNIVDAAGLVVGAQPRHVLEDAHNLRGVVERWLVERDV